MKTKTINKLFALAGVMVLAFVFMAFAFPQDGQKKAAAKYPSPFTNSEYAPGEAAPILTLPLFSINIAVDDPSSW